MRKQTYFAFICIVLVAVAFSTYYTLLINESRTGPPTILLVGQTDSPVHPFDSTFPTTRHFYEFCNQETVHPIVLPAISKTLWLTNYDDSYNNSETIVFAALLEDHSMANPDPNRVQVKGDPNLHLVSISIFDASQKKYLACKIVDAWDQNEVICPHSPSKVFRNEVESIYFRVRDTHGNIVNQIIPLCKRIQPPLHNMSLCVAFVHDTPDLFSRLVEFIEYHRMAGFDHITFYARTGEYRHNLTNAYPPHLLSFVSWPGIAHNRTTIKTRFNGYYDQQIALNHCLYQQRRRSIWLGLWDFDEYSIMKQKGPDGNLISLSSVLAEDPLLVMLRLERLTFATQTYDHSLLVTEQFTTWRTPTQILHKPIIRPWHVSKVSIHGAEVQQPYHTRTLDIKTEGYMAHYVNLIENRRPDKEHGINTDALWALKELKPRVAHVLRTAETGMGAEEIMDFK